MPNVVLNVGTAHVNMTGIGLMQYADRYFQAARRLGTPATTGGFDPVPYQLYCQSLELRLKAYIWLQNTALTRAKIRNLYGHDLAKLWKDAKLNGVARFVRVTPLRDIVVSLVAPYYKDRKFCYTDVVMTFHGYRTLNHEPRAIPTIARLVAQLGSSLRKPILSAS